MVRNCLRRKRNILIVALLVAVAGWLAWLSLQPGEPVYEGKPLSFWLHGYDSRGQISINNLKMHQEADDAVHDAGSKAVPTLLRLLQADDPPWKVKWFELLGRQHILKVNHTAAQILNYEAIQGFRASGADAKSAVPVLIKIYERNLSPKSQEDAVMALGAIGPAASEAVPLLAAVTNNVDWTLRENAAWALGRIHAAPEISVPALRQFMHDRYGPIQQTAAIALCSFGEAARPAVPDLVELLKDMDIRLAVRDSVIKLVCRLDPETAVKSGIEQR
jgi:HEAT repeat protein